MAQTICTRILASTNCRPKRIKASTTGGNHLTLTYEDDWKELDNHMQAAILLAEQANWYGTVVSGTLNTRGDMAWVFILGEPYFIRTPHKCLKKLSSEVRINAYLHTGKQYSVPW